MGAITKRLRLFGLDFPVLTLIALLSVTGYYVYVLRNPSLLLDRR